MLHTEASSLSQQAAGMCLYFGLIAHIRNGVDRDERLRILAVHKIHQLLVFGLVHNGNDLAALFHIVGSEGFVHRCPAVQIVQDKMAQLLLLFGNNADAALDVVVKNKVIQHDTVKIGAQYAEHDGLFVVDQRGRQRHAHAGK